MILSTLLLVVQVIAAAVLPAVQLSKIDEGLNPELADHVISYLDSVGVFNNDDGPLVLQGLQGSALVFNDHSMTFEECMETSSRDGCRNVYSQATFHVADNGKMVKVLVDIHFKH